MGSHFQNLVKIAGTVSVKEARSEPYTVLAVCNIIFNFYAPDFSGRIIVWRCRLSVRPSICLSVCPTVRLSVGLSTKLVNSIQTELFQLGPSKLGTHTTYDKRKTTYDFQGLGQRSRS